MSRWARRPCSSSSLGVDLFIFGHGAKTATGETLIAVYVWVLLVVFQRERRPLLQLGYGALYLIYAALPKIALWYHLAKILGCHPAQSIGGRWGSYSTLVGGAIRAPTSVGACWSAQAISSGEPESNSRGRSLRPPICGAASSRIADAQSCRPLPYDYWILPLIVGIAGQIGDLIESLMKREAGIKDSSQIIPGHGGFLDRFDSLLVSSPLLAYLFLSTHNPSASIRGSRPALNGHRRCESASCLDV